LLINETYQEEFVFRSLSRIYINFEVFPFFKENIAMCFFCGF